jgi:outer membrane protein TolC
MFRLRNVRSSQTKGLDVSCRIKIRSVFFKLILIINIFSHRDAVLAREAEQFLHTEASHSIERADSLRVFRRLLSFTEERSSELRLARSSLEQKIAARKTARARWAPRLDLRLSENVSKDFSALTSGSLGSAAEQLFVPAEVQLGGYQLSLQMPIYNRAVHLGLRRGELEADLASVDLTLAVTRLNWSLRQDFGNFLLKKYRVATVERSLVLGKSNLQEAELRYRLGSRTIIDVLRAQAQLAQLEARRVTYESDLAEAMSRLLQATGLSSEELEQIGIRVSSGSEADLYEDIEDFVQTESLLVEITGLPVTISEITTQIESASPSLARLRLISEVEAVQGKGLLAPEWPELVLRASLNKQSPDWARTFSSAQTSYSYGLVLNIPLFLFSSSLSLYREASEIERSSETKRRRESDVLGSSTQTLILRGRALAKSIESLRFGLNKNLEVERLTQRSYQLGKSSFLDLQIAQNDLVESKIQLAQAQIELSVLVWQIRWNMGLESGARQ